MVGWARGKIIEAAAYDGNGEDGRAFWYRKQPSTWHPDFAAVPITPIEKCGPEHRYGPEGPERDLMAEPMAMADASAALVDPLARPLERWTEQHVAAVLNAPAYLRSQHPQHVQAQTMVRAWFAQRHPGTVQVDATGRQMPARVAASASGACEVRAGRMSAMRARCRSTRTVAPGPGRRSVALGRTRQDQSE